MILVNLKMFGSMGFAICALGYLLLILLMYLNKKTINSSRALKDFIEKYSLFSDIKNYKKVSNSLYGALIIRYGNVEKEGKYRYSHEYFLKKD